jgi:hypothetical protein
MRHVCVHGCSLSISTHRCLVFLGRSDEKGETLNGVSEMVETDGAAGDYVK